MAEIDNGVILEATSVGSGTGNYDSFLRLQANGTEEGFSTDQNGNVVDNKASFTHSITYGSIQTVTIDGIEYVEFRLDLNESDNGGNPNIQLEDLKIYVSGAPATLADFNNTTDTFGSGFSLAYSMDTSQSLVDSNTGSGTDDYRFLIPVSLLEAAGATDESYITLYSQFSGSNGGFEEWRVRSQQAVTPNPVLTIDKVFLNVTGGDGDALADSAGDVLNYTVTVTNTGNVTLTNVSVVDPVTGLTITGVTLAPGASQTYNTSYTLTQADLDGKGGGDGDMDNTATADSAETNPVSDSEAVPLVYDPKITIDKVFVNVTGGDGDALADWAGDVLNYTVKVTNTGNITLTGVTVIDPLTGQSISGVTLAPGASQTYNTSYTLTQADLDGKGGGDGDIDNTATADSNETGSVSDSEIVALLYDPKLGIDKIVTGVFNKDGSVDEDGTADSDGDYITYDIIVSNLGNITLTGVSIADPLLGGILADDLTILVGDDYIASGQYTVTQADLDGKGGGDGEIDNTATADSNETGSVSDSEIVALLYDPKLGIDKIVTGVFNKDGSVDEDGTADSDGDYITYDIIVSNLGNITLTDVSIDDPLIPLALTGLMIAVGENHTESVIYTVTQADLDGNGGGDGDIDNPATADSAETGEDSDTEEVPLLYNPDLGIDKVVVGVFNKDGSADEDGIADAAGDYITYDIIVKNLGNITLTGVSISDPLIPLAVTGLTIAVGEEHTENVTYTVTQADLDSKGGGDGDIDNTATADSNQTGPTSDSTEVDLLYNASVDIEKYVRVNQDGVWTGWLDADSPTGPIADQDDAIEFKFEVTNTGNITLTNVTISDSVYDLNGLVAGASINLGTLAVGASGQYIYTGATFQAGQHTNTGTVTTTQGATDSDNANYKGVFDGPGVRTPGFWSNLGLQYWDGQAGFAKAGPNFPDHELAPIGPKDSTYLILGGDHDNSLGAGEIQISLADALKFINASQKDQQDGRWMLARDVIATELNIRAGNPGTDSNPLTTHDPQQLLDAAVAWLRGTTQDNNATLTTTEMTSWKVGTSTAAWNGVNFDADPTSAVRTVSLPYSAADMHKELDQYNNTGFVGSVQYANDGG